MRVKIEHDCKIRVRAKRYLRKHDWQIPNNISNKLLIYAYRAEKNLQKTKILVQKSIMKINI